MTEPYKFRLEAQVEKLAEQVALLTTLVGELTKIHGQHQQNSEAIDKYVREWHMNQGADPDG